MCEALTPTLERNLDVEKGGGVVEMPLPILFTVEIPNDNSIYVNIYIYIYINIP